MKVHKFDCLGRVPASIEELKKCEMCLNEEICMGISSASYLGASEYDQEAPGYYQKEDERYSFSESWKE